jgi:hypothetical protein
MSLETKHRDKPEIPVDPKKIRNQPEVPVDSNKVQKNQREIQQDPVSRKTPEMETPVTRETPEVPKIPPKESSD